ncbi:hypothetical protein FRC12_008953 [Ceratobasidium sp. 428]|nr:hypothetical protein FRC12_008953 [Ceratobasidium sp. 428]
MPWIPLWIKESLMDVLLYSASQGALTQLYAGVIPEARHLSGKFLVPWTRERDPGPFANDTVLSARLWDWCAEQVKGH